MIAEPACPKPGGHRLSGPLVLLAMLMVMSPPLRAADVRQLAAHPPPPPAAALGYPSRAPDLDARPGFRNPPPGYGQVPFWWWTGDPLDKERLLWQIEELHAKGIAGVQVNYAHEDTPGWPTYKTEPELFSDAWWDVWKFVAGECAKRDMGIGLSGYTIDWPNGRSFVSRTIYSEPEIVGRELKVAHKLRVQAGQVVSIEVPADALGARAYPVKDGAIDPVGRDLAGSVQAGRLAWTAPAGEWEVWVFASTAKGGALNPMHPLAGRRVVEKFFQRFQDNAPGQSAKGLNYFFHDELQFGVGDPIWTEDFADQFRARKGYDVFEALPALFADVGPRTPKARLDYMDVRMQLIQERYFIPIFDWHWSRGLIYGCDQGSRGRDPIEFGDYFSAVRWYTAPGHDTPGGHADLIKGKVSSSIAQLYRRPRVWLEGYHSLGWGAAPERLMQATCENYLYGCNLLNLHGLYYSTHGSFWEWAPPCYHFRMPYWEHMGTFLKYFERLSYLMSQGTHQCDVAVLYPVTPGQAGLGGQEATDVAFDIGTRLFTSGRDFIFIDDESVERARIEGGRLHVSDASYRVLILPALRAVRWSTLQQALAFRRAGGLVIAVGALPEASDRAGRDDPELDAALRELFGATAAQVKAGARPAGQPHPTGGLGAGLFAGESNWAALASLLHRIPLDVVSEPPLKAVHRKVGPRDVYLLLGAEQGSECTFRATGRAELWDPWTGEARPIHAAYPVPGGTRLRLPLGPQEAQLIVFSPGQPDFTVTATDLAEIRGLDQKEGRLSLAGFAATPGRKSATVERGARRASLHGEAAPTLTLPLEGLWEFELTPTMNNRWGDFRLPVTEPLIGAEARLFRYAEERTPNPGWERPETDDSAWPRVTHGFGPMFWKLGPLPAEFDPAALDQRLAALPHIDPAVPVEAGGKSYAWSPYAFSWRWGKEGDPGHQGYHGLKENVTNGFICLGKPGESLNETVYGPEAGGTRYYLWTTAQVSQPARAQVEVGGLKPAALYLNGKAVAATPGELALTAGANPLLLRYDAPGRGYAVLRRLDAGQPRPPTPLSMSWGDDPAIVPYDVRPAGAQPVGWYRFAAPPGLRALTLTAHGEIQAWVDGVACRVIRRDERPGAEGARSWRLEPPRPVTGLAQVALRITQERGRYGGAALPEPIALDCGRGLIALGDWSKGSALENYSGGAWYRKDVALENPPAGGRVFLDLGDLVATAEVRINGESAGIRVAPPWVVDISSRVRAGTNRVEVLVYNTLANHFLTIPTRYRGPLRSGLMGPVQLRIQPLTVLTE